MNINTHHNKIDGLLNNYKTVDVHVFVMVLICIAQLVSIRLYGWHVHKKS